MWLLYGIHNQVTTYLNLLSLNTIVIYSKMYLLSVAFSFAWKGWDSLLRGIWLNLDTVVTMVIQQLLDEFTTNYTLAMTSLLALTGVYWQLFMNKTVVEPTKWGVRACFIFKHWSFCLYIWLSNWTSKTIGPIKIVTTYTTRKLIHDLLRVVELNKTKFSFSTKYCYVLVQI